MQPTLVLPTPDVNRKAAVSEECLDLLSAVSKFLNELLYTSDLSSSSGGGAVSAVTPPTALTAAVPEAHPPRRSSDVALRDAMTVKLIGYLEELDAKIMVLKMKMSTTPPDERSFELGEHAVSEMGTIQLEGDSLLMTIDDMTKKRVSFRTRSSIGGWLSLGTAAAPLVTGVTPTDLTPIQRSISMAFGRRRRSTFLVGMPALVLDVDAPNAVNGARISRKTTRHNPVFRPETEFRNLLRDLQLPCLTLVQSLDFDCFTVDAAVMRRTFNGLPTLTVVAMNIMMQYGFVTSLRLDTAKLIMFLNDCSACFRDDNPYHNQLHAANTLQMVHLYAKQPTSGMENFADIEIFALFFAALTMHLGHLGVDDSFLELTKHPLRAIYPEGTQRSMSLAMALAVLSKKECNFFQTDAKAADDPSSEARGEITTSQKDRFVALVSQLVLHSDETLHQELMAQLKWIQDKGFVGNDHVVFVLAAVLRLASAAHVLKSPNIFHEWIARLTAENYRQGAAQLEHYFTSSGLSIPPSGPLVRAVEAQLLPNQQPGGIRVVDFFHNVARFIMLPLVQFPKNVFPSSWIDRVLENITILGGPDNDDVEKTLLRRVKELFDYPAAFSNPLKHSPWCDVPNDSANFFALVAGDMQPAPLPLSSAASRGSGIVRSRNVSAPASFRSMRDMKLAVVEVQNEAVATLQVVDELVRYVRAALREAVERCKITAPWAGREDYLTRLTVFSKGWIEIMEQSQSTHCRAAFLSSAALASTALPAKVYDGAASSPTRMLPRHRAQGDAAPPLSDVEAVALCKSLLPPSDKERAAGGLAPVAASIVGNLTQMWLDFGGIVNGASAARDRFQSSNPSRPPQQVTPTAPVLAPASATASRHSPHANAPPSDDDPVARFAVRRRAAASLRLPSSLSFSAEPVAINGLPPSLTLPPVRPTG